MEASSSTNGRGTGDRPPFGLADLISPISVDTFKTQYWENRHLLIHRGEPDYFADLLTLADMDHLLATTKVRSSDLRIVANGTERPLSELVTPEAGNYANAVEELYNQYRKGATINLLFLQEQWEPLARLCQVLAGELSALCHVNVYLTPAGAVGLGAHYDTHDVFVAQVYGSKRWRLSRGPLRLPLRSQPARKDQEPGEQLAEFDLRPGDLLYMPRGTVHQAVSNDTASLHLTVGVQPVLWADVIRGAVDRIVERDDRYREGLPPGFTLDRELQAAATEHAKGLLDALHDAVQPAALVADARRKALLARKPALEGHLIDLERMPNLDLDTTVRRRANLAWQLNDNGDGVDLEFHGKGVHFPPHVIDELRYLTEADRFTGRQIPGELDEPGRLVLLRTLVKEGFLTTV